MTYMKKIVILGCGGWGIALAILLHDNGNSVAMWSPFENEVSSLSAARGNEKLLPGIKLADDIAITGNIGTVSDADVVIIATPSVAVRSTAERLRGVVNDRAIIVDVAKGFDEQSLERLSEVIARALPNNPIAALSGPSHAEEVARGVPTSLVAASADISVAEAVQDFVSGETMRVYVNTDIIGVEVGGALKNIIALACGIGDGLGVGDNTRAALMTRGLTEIARLGCAMGADKDTFAGLAGLGDLIVTCTSMHSRNRRFGIEIGRGKSVQEALDSVGMTVEGYHAVKTAHQLAQKYGVNMPIANECYNVLYCGAPVDTIVSRLMSRPKRHELDTNWLK